MEECAGAMSGEVSHAHKSCLSQNVWMQAVLPPMAGRKGIQLRVSGPLGRQWIALLVPWVTPLITPLPHICNSLLIWLF